MSSTIPTKILIISDTHGIPFSYSNLSVDVVIHCGDLTDESKIEEFRTTIQSLRQTDALLKLAVAGNHDFTLDDHAYRELISETVPRLGSELVFKEFGHPGDAQKLFDEVKDAGVSLLLQEGIHRFPLANGALLTVYASSWTPSSGNMGFQYDPREGHDFSIPDGTDVVITHGPPWGVFDRTSGRERVGCPRLFEAVARARPRIHCFGHVHDSWGAKRVTWRETYGDTPTHFNAIDNDRSTVIETLTEETLTRYKGVGYVETDQMSSSEDEAGQTLFVNAAMARGGELLQLPWVVHVSLPAAGDTERPQSESARSWTYDTNVGGDFDSDVCSE